MSSEESNLATAKMILSTLGSIAATAVVVRTVVCDYLPPEFQEHISYGLKSFFNKFSNQLTMVIDEFDGLVNNEVYVAAEVYLGQKVTPNTRRVKISKPEKEKSFNITMERNEEVIDIYNGVKLKWLWACKRIEPQLSYNPRDRNATLKSEVRCFELTFNKKHKDMVINSYLPYLLNEAMLKKQQKKTLKIFTLDYENIYDLREVWIPVNLDHPATFEKLAMDISQKELILNDLERFVKRKEYYKKIGKAWKRGYLLYGPPGTGKSSLVAAMANFLNFDIYDLELTELKKNSDLRKILVATANKSIMVVEDIDCTIDLQNKLANRDSSSRSREDQEDDSKVTLSGLLNFIDGLWSSCGDERIIIFTTNHIEKLDPALLRPGRMDVHIHMSYCTPDGFKLLAANYLGINDHILFPEIEELITSIKVTPAEVAEQLLKCDGEPDVTFQGLIHFLHQKKKKDDEDVEVKKVEEIDDDDDDDNDKGSEKEGQIKKDDVGDEEDKSPTKLNK